MKKNSKKIFVEKEIDIIFADAIAKIAQLVEHDLAKVGVAGSSPVFRSTPKKPFGFFFFKRYNRTHTNECR